MGGGDGIAHKTDNGVLMTTSHSTSVTVHQCLNLITLGKDVNGVGRNEGRKGR